MSEKEPVVHCEKCGKPLVRTSATFFTCETQTKEGLCRGLIPEGTVFTVVGTHRNVA